MDLLIPPNAIPNLYLALRRLGYAPRHDGQSYEHRLRSTPYPRFHVYVNAITPSSNSGNPMRNGVNEQPGGAVLRLHLDQKQPSYGGGTRAHAGEYDGPLVTQEIERMRRVIGGS